MISKRSVTVLVTGWFIAACFMVVRGRTDAVAISTDLVFPLIIFVLACLTMRIAPVPSALPTPMENRLRVFAQLVVIIGVIALTGVRGLDVHAGAAISIPAWSSLLALFGSAGARVGMASDVTNFGSYVVVPGVLVLLLGANLTEIGFARFAPRTGAISLLWLSFPAVLWIVAITTRHVTLSFMLFQLVRNFLSNGFSEEFLWRGLLFTRLRAFVSTEAERGILRSLPPCTYRSTVWETHSA